MKNQKKPLFLGRAQKKKKAYHLFLVCFFLIVAWATIHAYVEQECAINYVVLRSQALAVVTTLTHTLVIYEPYTIDPLPPRQPLSNARDRSSVILPV